jgi:hypothetical protein
MVTATFANYVQLLFIRLQEPIGTVKKKGSCSF